MTDVITANYECKCSADSVAAEKKKKNTAGKVLFSSAPSNGTQKHILDTFSPKTGSQAAQFLTSALAAQK